ncbi:TonB-dependent receptor [Parabacteroides sp. PF5-6]|uniref:TonB-dependent receptor n=1 Tax=Parabacteroides sp. PF5-6 TaxID=1742403 RepID=UPI0024051968|nr:TonB-dependent receptor [Parabacteroides sp. PF5-6]MDF9831565.1 outer membrane cobalamin receptor [Parabacteroides sp. PF5-6]
MKEHVIHFFLVVFMTICCAGTLSAQTTVKGKVVDAENDEPLIGAAVMQRGTTQGVVTDIDGNFEIKVSPGSTLVFRSLGYKEATRAVSGSAQVDLGTIGLAIDAIGLADVTITSSIAIDRKTPVALATVSPEIIDARLGVKEFPEILKVTPGVHVIRQGGGFGDSNLNLRGFKSENVAVMVNGVPMNDMEWGGLYWSNWAGLSDVTRSMQVQRGLGASKVSSPSVGGSINIVTNTIDVKKGGFASYLIGSNGRNKLLFKVSTGLSPTGWAFTLMGGKDWGNGYVQGTEFEAYNYFLNISKRFNDKHHLSLTAFGAPQVHNQRGSYDGLTIEGWQDVKKYMEPGDEYKYNATYGFGKNGERKTSAKNKYHKPQISLNHMWQIDDISSLSTAAYVSIGDGWGYSGQGTSAYSSKWYGSTNGVLNMDFRNPDGTFAYDQIQDLNENSKNGSQMVMSVSKNQHMWYGLLSTYTRKLTENIDITGGFDGRYYIGTHTNEIIDLYNGEYYIDRNRANVKSANYSGAGTDAFKNKKLSVGDVVYRDYDGHVLEGGLFGQAEYSTEQLTAFVSATGNYTSQWRYDRFYYSGDNRKSDAVNKFGFSVKGGANYNLNDYHNVFANVGYISRRPHFSGGAFLQSTTSHEKNSDAVNEKILSFELGYGFRSSFLSANLNVYRTHWNDKTMARSGDYTLDGVTDRYSVNMTGVNAVHQGIELDVTAHPFHWLDMQAALTIGDYQWANDPTGYFYNSSGQPLTESWGVASGVGASDHAKTDFKLDGIKVGGSAQTTLNISATFKPTKDLRFGMDWNMSARNYADWTFSTNDLSPGGVKEFASPWRIPKGNSFDAFASYSFKIGTLPSTFYLNMSNVFNQTYIESAYNGADNDWQTAYRVFYALGREMSARIRINF